MAVSAKTRSVGVAQRSSRSMMRKEAQLRESVAKAALGAAHLRRVGAAAAGDPVIIPTEEVGRTLIGVRRVGRKVPERARWLHHRLDDEVVLESPLDANDDQPEARVARRRDESTRDVPPAAKVGEPAPAREAEECGGAEPEEEQAAEEHVGR
eukprot:scaffold61435_cov63-Phaeocystis_antarctica.AAC.1